MLVFIDKEKLISETFSVEVRRLRAGKHFLSEAKDQTRDRRRASSPSRMACGEVRPDLELGLMLLSIGPVLILVVLIVVLSLLSPVFLTPRNFSNILAQTAVITVVAMGQHLVILTRGIDLSVGSNLALASVVGALLFHAGGSPAAVDPGDGRIRRAGRRGQRPVLCLRPAAASLHHHAGHAEHLQGRRAAARRRPRHPRNARRDPRARPQRILRPAGLGLRRRRRRRSCCWS